MIVATSAAKGAADAEFDTTVDEFDTEGEVIGYTRRMAEETFRMAHQLDLDFDYSNISVFNGDVAEDEPDSEHPDFVGMWFFADDGAGWADAASLRADAEAESEEQPAIN